MTTDPVAALLAQTGVTPGSGSVVDWAAVEGSLRGLALPADYKRLIENFPLGRFKESVTVIRPAAADDFLGYFAARLEDYRSWREGGYGTFPYPLFPEPGGLLPWAFAADGTLIFWLTGDTDPNRWPVVITDSRQASWQVHEQSAADYLAALLTDPPAEVTEAPAFLPQGAPRPAASPSSSSPSSSSPSSPVPAPPFSASPSPEPVGYSAARRPPENRADELIAAVGATAGAKGPRDWEALGRAFGAEPPGDYRAFYDAAGAGIFCDIAVFGLDAPPGLGMADLLQVYRSRVAGTPGAGQLVVLHPEPGGLIPWGATTDGAWTFFWDPKTWGVSAVNSGFRRVDSPETSFSDFLLRYAAGDESQFLFGRPPWTGGPTFQAM
jgi:hypothetical protein